MTEITTYIPFAFALAFVIIYLRVWRRGHIPPSRRESLPDAYPETPRQTYGDYSNDPTGAFTHGSTTDAVDAYTPNNSADTNWPTCDAGSSGYEVSYESAPATDYGSSTDFGGSNGFGGGGDFGGGGASGSW